MCARFCSVRPECRGRSPGIRRRRGAKSGIRRRRGPGLRPPLPDRERQLRNRSPGRCRPVRVSDPRRPSAPRSASPPAPAHRHRKEMRRTAADPGPPATGSRRARRARCCGTNPGRDHGRPRAALSPAAGGRLPRGAHPTRFDIRAHYRRDAAARLPKSLAQARRGRLEHCCRKNVCFRTGRTSRTCPT